LNTRFVPSQCLPLDAINLADAFRLN